MTTKYEGSGATSTRITIHAGGEEIGYDEVPEGHIALAFNYDEVFYVQGTPDEVHKLLVEAIVKVDSHLVMMRLKRGGQ